VRVRACVSQIVALQFAELKRWQDFRHPGSQGKQYFLGLEAVFGGSGEPAYPGTHLPPTSYDLHQGCMSHLSRKGFCSDGCTR
jgi:hypothetical protein